MYKYINNGSVVTLNILVGADSSLIGLKFRNCEIKSITVEELTSIATRIYGPHESIILFKSLSSKFLPTEPKETLIVLEEVSDELLSCYTSILFFNYIKLYKAMDLYSCYSLNYKIENELLKFGGTGKVAGYEHPLSIITTNFSMTESEKQNFPTWFEKYSKILGTYEFNEIFQKAYVSYNHSYYIADTELEFVMLSAVLEMIFVSGRSEISYQISRGVALILSNNPTEMNIQYKKMQKLYNERSRYVHECNTIKYEKLVELRDIVRKVLLKIIELEYHTKDKSFTDFKQKILCGGFTTL